MGCYISFGVIIKRNRNKRRYRLMKMLSSCCLECFSSAFKAIICPFVLQDMNYVLCTEPCTGLLWTPVFMRFGSEHWAEYPILPHILALLGYPPKLETFLFIALLCLCLLMRHSLTFTPRICGCPQPSKEGLLREKPFLTHQLLKECCLSP
jgi:hypothetical protein